MLEQIFKNAKSGHITIWAKDISGSRTEWFDVSKHDVLQRTHQTVVLEERKGFFTPHTLDVLAAADDARAALRALPERGCRLLEERYLPPDSVKKQRVAGAVLGIRPIVASHTKGKALARCRRILGDTHVGDI